MGSTRRGTAGRVLVRAAGRGVRIGALRGRIVLVTLMIAARCRNRRHSCEQRERSGANK
jgi:hypothetical protein